MRKSFKTITAAALSAAMILVPSMTSFADDEAPTTTGATGNVLAYKCESIVVPTALKLAINPNGTAVNTKYAALASDATFSAATKYYTESDGAYSLATVTSDTFADLKETLFTAVTSTDQIVSFKYGLVSKATAKRNVAISFSITADSDIEFVEDANSATAPTDENDDTHTAEPGELKMFLAVTPGNAVPTAATKKKTADTSLTANKAYYTKGAGNAYTKVESPDADDLKDYYEDTDTIGAEILPSELADVGVATLSTVPIAFTAEGAEVAFKLDPATYTLKADEFIDWDTTQTAYGEKLEITTIGGVASFTFTGAMNKDADWTSVDATIVIEPEYDFTASDGTETAIATGKNQIEVPEAPAPVDAAPSIATTEYTAVADTEIEIAVNLGAGEKAATGIASVTYKNKSGADVAVAANTGYTFENGKVVLSASTINAFVSATAATREFTITFNDTDSTAITVTVSK